MQRKRLFMKRKLVTGQESEAGLDQLPRSKLSQNSVLPEGWRARRPSLASLRMENGKHDDQKGVRKYCEW